MDGFHQVIKVPGDLNPNPRGTEAHTEPKGGLQHYQDDLDTSKKDVVSDEIGDDPSQRIVGGAKQLGPALDKTDDEKGLDQDDDLREDIEDRDEADKNDR
jgi:hypothetical protein